MEMDYGMQNGIAEADSKNDFANEDETRISEAATSFPGLFLQLRTREKALASGGHVTA